MEWGENLPKKTAEVATAAGISIPGVNAPVASVHTEEKPASTDKAEPKETEVKPEKKAEKAEQAGKQSNCSPGLAVPKQIGRKRQ